VTIHRVSAKNDLHKGSRRGGFTRAAGITFLCLCYLVSNTAVLPSLDQGKSCHCADQLKTSSQCCCSQSTLNKNSTTSKSCCSTGNQPVRSCCSQQAKQISKIQTDSPCAQISSLCGCDNSTENGLNSANPRKLNPRPILSAPGNLTLPLKIVNDLPVMLAFAPDTPPPQ